MNLSFSGCGFMGIYHIGVASAIKEYAPHLITGKITGASAGALAACGLISGICLGQATSDVLKTVIQARAGALGPMRPSFNLVRILRQGLLKSLPSNAHEICNGRLHISLTRFSDGKNVLVSQFDTMNDLVQALICSMFIPFYCGAIPPTYRGERYIDGGWSDNMPQLDENTITVSPFSGESDICPQDSESASFLSFDLSRTNVRFTARNIYRIVTALFPPHPEIMSEMCRQGFEDALRFLAQNDLLACTRCVSIRSSIFLTSDRRLDSQGTMVSETDEEAVKVTSVDEITASTTPATPSSAIAAKKPKAAMTRAKTAPRLPRIRTISSSTNFRRMSNQPIVSEAHMHDVDEDECESCRETATIAVGKGLPKVVRDTLADAEAGERTLLTRLWGLAPIRWIRYLAVPWLLPLDMTYAMCKKFLEWLPTISEDATWLIERASEALKFILSEIEAQKKQHPTRFTCQMAITEMNYSNIAVGMGSPVSPSTPAPSPQASTANLGAPIMSRRGSIVSAESRDPAPGQWTVAETNLGFSVDLNKRSQNVRDMATIVQKDRPESSKFPAAHVAHVADGLGWEGLQKAVNDGASPHHGSTENIRNEDLDNFASILAFTRRQEALMAYYYLDENNQMKVTEIYGINKPDGGHSSFGGSRSCSTRHSMKDHSRSRHSKDDSGISGVSAAELEAAILAKVPEASASGGVRRQNSAQQSSKEKEREGTPAGSGGGASSSGTTGIQRSSSLPKHRRSPYVQQNSASGSGSGRGGASVASASVRSKITFVSPISTASESEETEKLFVPDRRRRMDSEKEAAAYEPEDSSGED